MVTDKVSFCGGVELLRLYRSVKIRSKECKASDVLLEGYRQLPYNRFVVDWENDPPGKFTSPVCRQHQELEKIGK